MQPREIAEGLDQRAVAVDGGQALGHPALQAAVERAHVGVAEARENRDRSLRRTVRGVVVVVKHHGRGTPRHEGADLQFEPAERRVAREIGMALHEPAGFAHVQQGQLASGFGQQQRLQQHGCEGRGSAAVHFGQSRQA